MTNEYRGLIKELRVKKGISQLELANKLNISRASYIAVEQGKRDLTLSEAQKLADTFGVSLEEMESGIVADYAKYKEIILAFLRTSGEEDGKVPKTKLAKLLYLADFAWFYDQLKSMSGMRYRRIQFGPVPDSYFRALDELEEEGLIDVERKGDAILISENRGSARRRLITLNKEESGLIVKIAKKWHGKKTKEIVSFTHAQLPYTLCTPDEIIPYELITQEDPEHVY